MIPKVSAVINASSPKLLTIPQGATALVYEYEDYNWKVEYNSKIGFISSIDLVDSKELEDLKKYCLSIQERNVAFNPPFLLFKADRAIMKE